MTAFHTLLDVYELACCQHPLPYDNGIWRNGVQALTHFKVWIDLRVLFFPLVNLGKRLQGV